MALQKEIKKETLVHIVPYFDFVKFCLTANSILMNLQFLPCFLHHENHKTLVNPIVQC